MARSPSYADSFSVSQFIMQCGLICAVFGLWHSPLIQPVKLMVVLFHELSHGLMALFSGGQVHNVILTADEGGACETSGGVPLFIVSAGYLGSMTMGGLMLYLSRVKGCVTLVYILLFMTLTAAIFTVLRDPYSRRFATGLAAAFLVLGFLVPTLLGALFLRILGTVSCLYSIFDIYWDVLATDRPGYTPENDAVAIANLTGVSPHVVGLLWLGLSVLFFLALLKIMVLREPGVLPEAKQLPATA